MTDRAQVERLVDTHVHLVDFRQRPLTASDLARGLARTGIDRAVVFGVPVKKKWSINEPSAPTYYLDDDAPLATYSLTDELVATLVAELDPEVRARVAPLICGFDPTDLLAIDHVVSQAERHPCWRGIGEVFLRHDDVTELTYGENSRAGHPALDPVLDLCRSREWPMTFHQDVTSAGRPAGREYLDEVTAMLRRHREVTMVWAHGGMSRRLRPRDHPRLLEDLLVAYPNLLIELSWCVWDHVLERTDGGRLRARDPWVRLVGRHPERFVVGSDALGRIGRIGDERARWTVLLDELPSSSRRLVAAENALRVWWPGE